MTDNQSAALERWAETVQERSAIEEFFMWAGNRGLSYQSTMPLSDLLDGFYGINRTDLENGRRALIFQAMARNSEEESPA